MPQKKSAEPSLRVVDGSVVERDIADKLSKFRRLLTATELCEIVSISRSQLFRMARRGQLPSVRIGNSVRFDPKKFAEFLRSGK